MRYLVPQFIDVEDKLFGPLTLRQAVYLAGGLGSAFVCFSWFGFIFGTLFGVPVALLSFALAFVRVNERPFWHVVYAALFYFVRGKLYIWKRTAHVLHTATQPSGDGAGLRQARIVPQLTQSRLKQLAWSLDTNDTLYTNEKQWKQ